jgi:hypothetical protein
MQGARSSGPYRRLLYHRLPLPARARVLRRRQAERLDLLRRRQGALRARAAGQAVSDDAAALTGALPYDEELREAPPPPSLLGEDEDDGQSGGAAEGLGRASGGDAGAATAARREALLSGLGKRKRVVDVVAAALAASDSDGEAGSDSGDELDVAALNWRAKRV